MTASTARRRMVLGTLLALAAIGAAPASAGNTQSERFQPVQAKVTVPAGGRATVGIRVRRSAGAFKLKKVRRASVPRGLRVTWRRETGNGDLTLVITAARNLSPGTRTVRIEYVGGAKAKVRVVTPARRPSFTLAVEPSVVEAPLGEERELQMAVRRIDGFDDEITFTAEAPDDVTAELDPETLDRGASTAVLRVTGQAAGTHQVTVTADGGGQRRSVIVTVRAVEPPLPPAQAAFVLAANEVRTIPVSLIAGQTVTVRALIDVGDVDMSAFDATQARVGLSANNGTQPEELSLTGPGEFQVELRAVVDSTVRVETVEP